MLVALLPLPPPAGVALYVQTVAFMVATKSLLKSDGGDRVIMGRTVTRDEQVKGMLLLTVPLVWLSGVGGTIFWVIGAAISLTLVHASLTPPPNALEGVI